MNYQILVHIKQNHRAPLENLFCKINKEDQNKIIAKLLCLAKGNREKSKSLKKGLFELKIYGTQAYRIYYTYLPQKILLLILGGTKKSQSKDIEKATHYMRDFRDKGAIDDYSNTFQRFLEKVYKEHQ